MLTITNFNADLKFIAQISFILCQTLFCHHYFSRGQTEAVELLLICLGFFFSKIIIHAEIQLYLLIP